MNQMNLVTEIYLHQRQQEVFKEVAGYRQAREPMNGRQFAINPGLKFLHWLGKHLREIGLRLELLDVSQSPVITPQLQHGDQGNSA